MPLQQQAAGLQPSRWSPSSRVTPPGSPGWRAELQEERAGCLSDGSSWGRHGLEGHGGGATITALAVAAAAAEQEVQPEVPGRL